MERVCLLYSAGVESTVLLHELSHSYEVVPVYVSNGFAWEETELNAAENAVANLDGIQDLKTFSTPVDDLYPPHWSTGDEDIPDEDSRDEEVYLPGRNFFLLTKPAVFCSLNGINEIYHGTLGSNPFPDSTEDFFGLAERFYTTGLSTEIEIKTPYSGIDKPSVIERGSELDVPFEKSFSCIDPVDGEHCGSCNKCGERFREFRKTGVDDPITYVDGFR
ncbi:MAG: 7-cyano-7-deazaguanine synthase [Halobacteria archaeon]